MSERRDDERPGTHGTGPADETAPVPTAGETREQPATAPTPTRPAPAWASRPGASSAPDEVEPERPSPPAGWPTVSTPVAAATPGTPDDFSWRRPWSGWSAPGRWSGRRTVVALVAALGIGALGAVGATAAIAQSDDAGRGGIGHGQLGGRGQFGGGQGQLPGGGQGQLPGGGQGQPPGGPRDSGGDHHGFGDRDGDHGGDRDGLPGRPGQGQVPGQQGGGSTTPGDANGTAPTI